MKPQFAQLVGALWQKDLTSLVDQMAVNNPKAFITFAELFAPIIYERCVFFGMNPPEKWTEYCVMEISSSVPRCRDEIDPARFVAWVLQESWRILSSRNEQTQQAARLVRSVMRLYVAVGKIMDNLLPLQREILLLEASDRVWNGADMARHFGLTEGVVRPERTKARSQLLTAVKSQPEFRLALERLTPVVECNANVPPLGFGQWPEGRATGATGL